MSHKTEQAVLYKIFTEDNDTYPELMELVLKYFSGFTTNHGVGLWSGRREGSLTIEIVADYTDKAKVLRLAGDIKNLARQESVLVFTTTGLVNVIT